MNAFDLRMVKFIATGRHRVFPLPGACWIPCTIAIMEYHPDQFALFVVDHFDINRSYISPFKHYWRTLTSDDQQLMVWMDGTEEHQFYLETRLNGPTFVAFTSAFMFALNRTQLAWYHAQMQFWAAVQALPLDPYQWPNVVITPMGTLEPVNVEMNVDVLI